jgi:hypothetical protein
MKPIKVLFDRLGNTLNVWFDDPQKEHVSEETSEEVILVKDKDGKLIGFEVLNHLTPALSVTGNLRRHRLHVNYDDSRSFLLPRC